MPVTWERESVAEPISTGIAAALVTGATAAVSDGVKLLITNLASLVRDRFRRRPSDEEILEAALRTPRDPTTLDRLAQALHRHMSEDPEFATRVRELWCRLDAEDATLSGRMTNVVRGPVRGSVIQARDVQGGITLHAAPPPPRD